MDAIDRFLAAEGSYLGRGTNQNDETFVGELEIRRAVEGAGVFLHFKANGEGETPLHEDQMLLGRTRDGRVFLWGLDSTSERIRKHGLRRAEETDEGDVVAFGVGDPDDLPAFREEISFTFDGRDVDLSYSRGRPGEAFETRSSVDLVPEPFFSLAASSETAEVEYREFDECPDEETAEQIEQIYQRVFDPEEPLALADRPIWQESRSPHLVVGRVEDRVVGFKIGYERKPGRFYSWLGGVIPEFRRRGIATELLIRQHRWAARQGYRLVRTKTTNDWKPMLQLNLSQGFDVVGTELDPEGQLSILLDKPLDQDSSR